MEQHVVKSLAESVGNVWRELQTKYTKEGNFFVAAPLSSTPLPIYQWVVDHAEEFPSWDKVKFVLMDEQLEGEQSSFTYVPITDPASYEAFAKEHLLIPLQEETGVQVQIVKPEVERIKQFNTEIDLLILAVGPQGNYANVMPGAREKTGWHVAKLLPEFKKYHESKTYVGSHFRNFGMSLGPQQVLQAKHVVVIISGEAKKDLAKELLSGDSFDPQFPLSIIYHPQVRDRVVVYITEDAVE